MLSPKISVLVPVYNHERYVRAALDSILADPYPNKEAVIIDDGSTDNSHSIVSGWVEKHSHAIEISYLSRENKGITATLNELIRKSSGELLRLFASDDILVAGSLGAMASAVTATGKSAVVGDCIVINEDSVVVAPSAIRLNHGDPVKMTSKSKLPIEVILHRAIGGPCILIRKSFFELNGFYEESLRIDGWDLYLRLVARDQITFLNTIVAEHRIHSGNTNRIINTAARIRSLISQRSAGQLRIKLFTGAYKNLLIASISLLDSKISYLEKKYIRAAYKTFASIAHRNLARLKNIASLRDIDLILYAPTVHTGGGLVLISQLIESIPNPARTAVILDQRLPADILALFSKKNFAEFHLVQTGFKSRIRAERLLTNLSRRAVNAFLFGNLPSLFPMHSEVYIYFHNSLILGDLDGIDASARFRLIHCLKKQWFNLFLNKRDILMVQTPSMKLQLQRHIHPNQTVDILPFYASPTVPSMFGTGATGDASYRTKNFEFVYVASGDIHKNHRILLQAWKLLADSGLRPRLALTVDSARFPQLASQISELSQIAAVQITNFENIGFAEVIKLYSASRALIYPSLKESFGLPLLEALDLGLDLVTADRAYVFDICTPSCTFDPTSAESIVSAVRLFLLGRCPKPIRTLQTFQAREILQRCEIS